MLFNIVGSMEMEEKETDANERIKQLITDNFVRFIDMTVDKGLVKTQHELAEKINLPSSRISEMRPTSKAKKSRRFVNILNIWYAKKKLGLEPNILFGDVVESSGINPVKAGDHERIQQMDEIIEKISGYDKTNAKALFYTMFHELCVCKDNLEQKRKDLEEKDKIIAQLKDELLAFYRKA